MHRIIRILLLLCVLTSTNSWFTNWILQPYQRVHIWTTKGTDQTSALDLCITDTKHKVVYLAPGSPAVIRQPLASVYTEKEAVFKVKHGWRTVCFYLPGRFCRGGNCYKEARKIIKKIKRKNWETKYLNTRYIGKFKKGFGMAKQGTKFAEMCNGKRVYRLNKVENGNSMLYSRSDTLVGGIDVTYTLRSIWFPMLTNKIFFNKVPNVTITKA